MSTGSAEQALPDKCFAQQELYIFFGPAVRWQGLEKHHDLLVDISVVPTLVRPRRCPELCTWTAYLKIHFHQLL